MCRVPGRIFAGVLGRGAGQPTRSVARNPPRSLACDVTRHLARRIGMPGNGFVRSHEQLIEAAGRLQVLHEQLPVRIHHLNCIPTCPRGVRLMAVCTPESGPWAFHLPLRAARNIGLPVARRSRPWLARRGRMQPSVCAHSFSACCARSPAMKCQHRGRSSVSGSSRPMCATSCCLTWISTTRAGWTTFRTQPCTCSRAIKSCCRNAGSTAGVTLPAVVLPRPLADL